MCPDIAYVVNRLASYTANPSMQHTIALKWILRYLSGTRTHSITYKALSESKEFFSGYADAAYVVSGTCIPQAQLQTCNFSIT